LDPIGDAANQQMTGQMIRAAGLCNSFATAPADFKVETAQSTISSSTTFWVVHATVIRLITHQAADHAIWHPDEVLAILIR